VGTGRMREGYEGYARLLRRVAETQHQSCVLLTSREKLSELVPLESGRSPVHALRLEGLERDAGASSSMDSNWPPARNMCGRPSSDSS
jgi:hypothetical protein